MIIMRQYIIPALAFLAVFASCNKEGLNIESPQQASILATIENENNHEISKSDYDVSSGTEGAFYWSGVEKISVLQKSEDLNFTGNTFISASADLQETSIAFTGTPDEKDMDYALYPGGDLPNAMGWSSWTYGGSGVRALRLMIPGEFTYDSANPLKGFIPMIGKKDGSGNFVFKPATAVIAVSVKNLPSAARSITLSSPDKRLSGYYMITSSPGSGGAETNLNTTWNNGLTVAMAAASNQSTDCTSKFTFSSGLDKSEHTFYFPVSVGELPNGLVITIKDGDGTSLQTVTYSKSFTTVRAQISKLPLLDLSKATKVSVSGTSRQFYAYLTALGPDAHHVKFAVGATEEEALTAAASADAAHTITATGIENKVEVSDGLTHSGKYYLAYKIYTISNDVLYQSSIPVYFLTGVSETAFASVTTADWTTDGGSSRTTNGVTNRTKTNAITLIASDDPTKGNLMLTNFLGMTCDVSEKTCTQDITGYSDGVGMYSIYSYSDGTVTFKYDSTRPLYYDNSSHPHYLGGSEDGGGYEGYVSHAGRDILFYVNSNRLYSKTYPMASGHLYVYDIQDTSDNGTASGFSPTCRVLWLVLGTANTTLTLS